MMEVVKDYLRDLLRFLRDVHVNKVIIIVILKAGQSPLNFSPIIIVVM